jgi:hypothetical protein
MRGRLASRRSGCFPPSAIQTDEISRANKMSFGGETNNQGHSAERPRAALDLRAKFREPERRTLIFSHV